MINDQCTMNKENLTFLRSYALTVFFDELLLLAPDAKSARFLLAVSGGRDSVVLAHLFVSCDLNFDIAHCNFHLREEKSNEEMNFVQKLPFLTTQKVFVKEFNTLAIHQKSGKSIEMIARELRYQWFDEIGKEYDYIVTAHHANDNAETVIMNMLRGTGVRGMCGIPQKNGKIIRPLLRFKGTDIERYAREQEVGFCVDSSNLEVDFLRNKIRHHIIPELEKINPKVTDIFYKNSKLFQQQTQFIDNQIYQYKKKLLKNSNRRLLIPVDELRNLENQLLILYEILNPFGFNADDMENILKSLDAVPGKQFFSDTHVLIKDRTHLIIEEKVKEEGELLAIHSIEELKNHGFRVRKMKNRSNFEIIKVSHVIYVDTEKLTFPLTLKNWEKGDYFYPFGMKTKKKLSDFFTDLKIDILEKQKIRLLCSNGDIVWIIGYRADDRFKVEKNTKWYYIISHPRRYK